MLVIGLLLLLLYVGRPIIVPLAFAGVIAVLLYPAVKFFERFGLSHTLSIAVTMIMMLMILSIIILLLSTQIISFINDLPNIADQLDELLLELEIYLSLNFNIRFENDFSFVENAASTFLDSGVFLLQDTFSTIVGIFTFLGLVPIYIFLILLYRHGFKRFLFIITPIERHRTIEKILRQIQQVVLSYMSGLLTVMALVAVLNITILLLIGVDYAIFFGAFAALLMIIPYIGVFIGSTLPALYAFLTFGSIWPALLVIAGFSAVQFLEGNFITPRITGGKVQINALTALVALIIGGYLWGTAGLIIFLPLTAIIKVIFDNIKMLRPYGQLLGTDLYTQRPRANEVGFSISKKSDR